MAVTVSDPAVAAVINAHPLAAHVWDVLANLHRAGAFQAVHVRTTVEGAAASRRAGTVLVKEWDGVIRSQIAYENLSENAGRDDIGPLPWGGEWVIPNVLIVNPRNGELYFRVYVTEDSPRPVYSVNGATVSRDSFEAHLTPSQRNKPRPTGGTIGVKVGNIALR